jgi:hypothetical protein
MAYDTPDVFVFVHYLFTCRVTDCVMPAALKAYSAACCSFLVMAGMPQAGSLGFLGPAVATVPYHVYTEPACNFNAG